MELDIEVCRTIAIRYGLPLQFVVKEFHLMNVMGMISAFAFSKSSQLVFKGGTALSKVYLEKMQRFSEDADFDLVTKNANSALRDFCKRLAESMKGYAITEFRRVHNTMQFYCEYESPLGKDHVRVDISPKRLITAKPVEIKAAVSEFVHASVGGLTVYSIEDLTSRKLNALAARCEGKDVYDCHSALPLCAPSVLKTAIMRMLESEDKEESTEEFIQKAVDVLKKSDPKKLRSLTNPFIPSQKRPDWEELKNNLLMKLEALGE